MLVAEEKIGVSEEVFYESLELVDSGEWRVMTNYSTKKLIVIEPYSFA